MTEYTDEAEQDAEIERSREVVAAELNKALEAIGSKDVLVGVLLSILMSRAAMIAISNDVKDGFLRAATEAISRVMNANDEPASESDEPGEKPDIGDLLVAGFIKTARANAAVNDMDPSLMVPLMINAAIQLAGETDCLGETVAMIQDMNDLAADVERRRGETKH